MPDEDPFEQFTADFVQEEDPFSRFTSDLAEAPKTSATGAAVRSTARGVLPALGAAGGGALGLTAGIALAPPTGGLSMALPLAGMFLGGLGGAVATKKAQDVALEAIAPELGELEAADIAQHPYASFAGRMAANVPVFAIAPGQTIRGMASIPAVIRGAASEAQKQAAATSALQLGLGTAGGVALPLIEGEAPTLAGVGEAALQSALFGQPRLKALVPRTLGAAKQTVQKAEETLVPLEPTAKPAMPALEKVEVAKPTETIAQSKAPETFNTIQDVLDFRNTRINEEVALYQREIGLSTAEAEKLQGLLRRDASTAKFEKDIGPEKAAKLNDFFENSPYNKIGGPFEFWEFDRRLDPEHMSQETDKASLASTLVTAIAREVEPKVNSDRFLSAIVAARKLKENGGTLSDIARYLDSYTTRESGSQPEKKAFFDSLAGKVNAFLKGQGIDLPQGELGAKLPEGESVPKALPPPGTPPESTLGITPPGGGRIMRAIEALFPRQRETQPPVKFEEGPLPDLQPKPIANKIFSQPFAIGRIPVIGRFLDPNFSARTPAQEAISTWHSEAKGVGPAIASAVGEEIYGKAASQFKANANGDLNVTPTRAGQSLKISDVFEGLQRNPDSYIITPEQRAVLDEVVQPLIKRMGELARKYGLIENEEGPYFTRIVTERPETSPIAGRGGGKIGSKQFFQKERLFDTESEGWSKGYKYELNPERRIVTGIERLYRAIADKRLSQDESLGGTTRKALESQLRESYAEDLASGEMSEHRLMQIADSLQKKGTVYQPGFFQQIFPAETAQLLNKHFGETASGFRRAFVRANNFFKGLMLSFDLGVSFLQGQALLFRNPKLWGEASWESLKAIVDDGVFPSYVRENLEPIREMAQLGSGVGRLPEMLAGLERGEILERIPVVREAVVPFRRQFQTFLDVAKIELWKAAREATPENERLAVMRSIESMLSLGRMESIGMTERRALLERALLLAPSYYRGALNNIAGLAERGASGQMTKKALLAYVAGGLATYVGISEALKMAGMSDVDEKEMVGRLNPARSDFMQWTIKRDDGSTLNVGLGGIYRSLLRLMGNATATSIEHPENWKSLSPDKNPITKWYRGHAGPTVALSWTAFTGRDFMGTEADIKAAAGGMLPLALQGKGSMAERAFSFVGMSAWPENVRTNYAREREQSANEKFKKPYESLKIGEQVQVNRSLKKEPVFANRQETTQRVMELAFKADLERSKRLRRKLTPENQSKLALLGLPVPSYETSITIGRTRFPLTEKQQTRFEELIAEQYNLRFEKINAEQWAKLSVDNRKRIFTRMTTAAKQTALRKLKTEQGR